MLILASSSSSPRHRGRIERGVDGGDHRVIGGLATEMCGDRTQEMIALSDRQRRRRALEQRELFVREARTPNPTKIAPAVSCRAAIPTGSSGRISRSSTRSCLFRQIRLCRRRRRPTNLLSVPFITSARRHRHRQKNLSLLS
jgi:hypothetical protein